MEVIILEQITVALRMKTILLQKVMALTTATVVNLPQPLYHSTKDNKQVLLSGKSNELTKQMVSSANDPLRLKEKKNWKWSFIIQKKAKVQKIQH